MRADAHVHLFARGFRARSWSIRSPNELESYEGLCLERAVVVGYEAEERYSGNNRYILELARNHPWVEPLAFLHSYRPPDRKALTYLREGGFSGVALYLDDRALEAWSSASLRDVDASSSIVSINAAPGALAKAGGAIHRLSSAHVLVSHLGLPGPVVPDETPAELRERLDPVVHLARADNVFVKLSGLYAIDPKFPHAGAQPAVEMLLEAFGASRVVWGSDFSPALEHLTSREMMALPSWLARLLSSSEREVILGANLIGILGPLDREKALTCIAKEDDSVSSAIEQLSIPVDGNS
ncbi:MAG: amidohydrolase family protein [Dermatophilaceae bacterium]